MDTDVDQNLATEQDDQEWDAAVNEFSTEKGVKPDVEEDEKKPAPQEGEPDKGEGTGEGEDKGEGEEPKDEEEQAEDAEAQAARERAAAAREARAIQRDILAEQQDIKNDVMERLFKDTDGKLYDADGDEIKSPEDVMNLRNPATGKNFTEEEAYSWFLKASQHAAEERQKAEAQASEIVDTNLTIKEEADLIKERYGDFLAKPENKQLADELYQDWLATLEKHPETDVIVKAPVSLLRFYERGLKPYITANSKVSEAEAQAAEAKAKAEAAEAEKQKAQTRTDREDIYSRGDNGRSQLSQDEDEWAQAEKEYYGKR